FAARGASVSGALTLSGPIALTGDRTITTHDYPILSGTISGAHSLTVSGDSVLILSGNNTFSGGLTVNPGLFVLLDHDNAAGTGTVTLNAAKIQPFTHGLTLANSIALTGRSTMTSSIYDASGNEAGVTMTLNGQMSGTGALALSGIDTFVLPRA